MEFYKCAILTIPCFFKRLHYRSSPRENPLCAVPSVHSTASMELKLDNKVNKTDLTHSFCRISENWCVHTVKILHTFCTRADHRCFGTIVCLVVKVHQMASCNSDGIVNPAKYQDNISFLCLKKSMGTNFKDLQWELKIWDLNRNGLSACMNRKI